VDDPTGARVILTAGMLADFSACHEVNGKSAIEWVMERYQVSVDKDSQIKNDPNTWSDDPRYIVDLIKRIVRLSVDSVGVVSCLPSLNEKASAGSFALSP
jgi:predicted helicase